MLQIVAPQHAPYIFPCAFNSNLKRAQHCSYPGIGAEATAIVLEAAKIPYSITRMNITVGSDYHDSINQYLLEHNITACMTATIRHGTDSFTPFVSEPLFYEGMVVVYSASTPHSLNPFGFLTVYSLDMMLVLGLFWLLMKISTKYQIYKMFKWDSHSLQQMSQGRLMWCTLFGALFVGLYRCGLLSRLLVHGNNDVVNNIELLSEEIEDEHFKYYISLNRSHVEGQFSSTDEFGNFNKILSEIPHRILYAEHFAEAKHILHHLVGVIIIVEFEMYHFLPDEHLVYHQLYDIHRRPVVIQCSNDVDQMTMKAINRSILQSQQLLVGVHQRYEHLFNLWVKRSGYRMQQQTVLKPISIRSITGILLLGGFGVVIGVFILILEWVIGRVKIPLPKRTSTVSHATLHRF